MIQFFTFFLPISICLIWFVILILNYFFYEYRSSLYKLITNQSNITITLNKITVQTIIPTLSLVFNLYNIYIFYIFITINNFTFLNFNNLILMQLFLLNIFINIILYFFFFFKKLQLNIDFIIFLFFLIITSQTLLLFTNLLNIFFLLEIINMLILYSFINSITLKTFHKKNNYSTFWVIESCIYQFILNFIGSIIFYFFYNHLIINYYSVSLYSLSIISHNIQTFFVFNGLYVAFLLKFGIGPWLVYKLHMYKHFNLILLTTYTLIYFLTILIFFINLFLLYNFSSTKIFWHIIYIFILFVFYFILTFLYSYNNFLIFMSLSSLINFLLILLQLANIN